MLWTLLAALTFQLRQEIQRSARLSRRGAGEIKSISKSNEKNVNGNGNSPGGRTRENLVWSSSAGDLLHAGVFALTCKYNCIFWKHVIEWSSQSLVAALSNTYVSRSAPSKK